MDDNKSHKSFFITYITEEEYNAFNELCDGLKSGRDKDELSLQIEIVQAMNHRAFGSPEGIAYLEGFAKRKQQLALHPEKLSQRYKLHKDRLTS